MPEQKEDRNLYKEIVTNLLEGVMVISMKGKIAMLNPAAERILGLTQEDIGNSFVNVFLTREGTDDFNEVILDTVYEKQKVSNMPVDYMLEGQVRNLSLTTSYIHSNGEPSVVVVMEDVTELNELRDAKTALDKIKKLNREYEKAKDEAVRANEAKSLFLSNMSHEIRTPINAVLGMNEMILRECTDEQLLSYAANVQSSGKTLLFLINDILDMSKIESGKMEIVPAEYEVENLLMDLWNVIFLRAREKGLSIRFSLEETLPGTLYGDDVRIKQIVTNLLTNAVKYTPQGGVEMEVSHERQGKEELTLILSVRDTGMGIRKEDMGKLFESFQRLDEDKNRNIEGTGLGMNITMSLLKLMDGEMNVESEYGKGSVFTVRIPQKIVRDQPAGSFEAMQSRREKGVSRTAQGFVAPEAKVLVVDDNNMNLTVFKALLKRTQMKITTAGSGRQCLELAKNEKFHVIFMDHMMPEMDGIETLHEMQKLSDFPNRDTPVVVLTANAMAGAREGYLKEGFVDFLTKPIDGALLEQTTERYLPRELVRRPEAGQAGQVSQGGRAGRTPEAGQTGQASQEGQDGKAVREPQNGKVAQKPQAGQEEVRQDPWISYGISAEKGLSLAGDDMETYLELVGMFLKERSRQEDAMRRFLAERNLKDYAIWVHGLKGNARTLGADVLADTAFEHEKQSKAGNAAYAADHWEELLSVWDRTLEGFRQFLNAHGGGETDKYGSADPEGEALQLTEEDLAGVAALLDDFETDQAVERLKTWLGSPLEPSVRERLRNALTAIEDEFDEDKAIGLLKGD